MKLYTEEQVREAIKDAYLSGIERPIDFGIVNDSIIKSLTPIELPSDPAKDTADYIDRYWELRREIINTPPIYFWKLKKLFREYKEVKEKIGR